jgi:hypothetical protein
MTLLGPLVHPPESDYLDLCCNNCCALLTV